MYFGCQCSSARSSRLLLERSMLLGMRSAEIMPRSIEDASRSLPIKLRPPVLPVRLERAFRTDGVRPLKDPVLPCGQPAENLRFHRLRTCEPEVRLETCESVG